MPSPVRIAAFGMGLLGALSASQAPEFAQQYRQRLGGAIDELREVVRRFDEDARAVDETRDGALRRLAENPDEIARRQAAAMRLNAARLEALERQRRAMDEAGPFGRIAALALDYDPLVARGAAAAFEPAVPVTMEGAASAGTGFAAAWAATFGLLRLVALPFRRRGLRASPRI